MFRSARSIFKNVQPRDNCYKHEILARMQFIPAKSEIVVCVLAIAFRRPRLLFRLFFFLFPYLSPFSRLTSRRGTRRCRHDSHFQCQNTFTKATTGKHRGECKQCTSSILPIRVFTRIYTVRNTVSMTFARESRARSSIPFVTACVKETAGRHIHARMYPHRSRKRCTLDYLGIAFAEGKSHDRKRVDAGRFVPIQFDLLYINTTPWMHADQFSAHYPYDFITVKLFADAVGHGNGPAEWTSIWICGQSS